MPILKAGQISKGAVLEINGEPCVVTKVSFHHHSRGGGYCNLTCKNLAKNTSSDITFKSNDQLNVLDVSSVQHQFLYDDGDELVVMDPSSYEQVALPASLIQPHQRRLLTPDVKLYVMFNGDQPIAVALPSKVTLEVTTAHHEDAGNTAGSARKPVELETGHRLRVPLFIKTGDKVVVDTESGQYVSRTA